MNRRQTLLTFNSGIWQGCFVHLDHNGVEQKRFSTSLDVTDTAGVIQASLTNLHTGRCQSMSFRELPVEMQLTETGDWSLGPARVGPLPWVTELCVVTGEERRRLIASHGVKAVERIVYVRESRLPQGVVPIAQPLDVSIKPRGSLQIWQVDGDVELLVDPKPRGSQEGALCGLRWHHPREGIQQVVRRYSPGGTLLPLDPSW